MIYNPSTIKRPLRVYDMHTGRQIKNVVEVNTHLMTVTVHAKFGQYRRRHFESIVPWPTKDDPAHVRCYRRD